MLSHLGCKTASFTNHDLDMLVQRTSNSAKMSRDDFGNTTANSSTALRVYSRRATSSERERNKAFIDGFPKPVRDKVLARLAIVVPQRKRAKATSSAMRTRQRPSSSTLDLRR